jgi:7-carboxy-7-deazaguanine synthase
MRISETFSSRQGEGKLTGTPSFFIRTSGCNLRCWFCDTPYASWNPSGESATIRQLVDQALTSENRHVVLTGGEPLLPAPVTTLTEALTSAGMHLTIETAGTIDRPIACDLLSLSPKLSDSTPDRSQHPRWNRLHEARRMPVDVMRRLIAAAGDHQVKFVVGDSTDRDELLRVVDELNVAAENVFIMPQAITVDELDATAEWLLPWANAEGFQYCDRMQIRWYGNRRGT